MPYEWTEYPTYTKLEAWPFRSLPKRGFVIVISIAMVFLALPLVALVGKLAFWGLLPFMAIALGALWWGLHKSYKDGEVLEELIITPDTIQLSQHKPKKETQQWTCNPYWTSVHLHESNGPVPYYVTLKGNGREVEIGAFLSEDERRRLYDDLLGALRKAN